MKSQKNGTNFNSMIIEAVQGNYSFFAWQSLGGIVEKCEMKIKAYRKDYNEIELEARPEHEDSLAKVISGNRILNIYVPEISVSFTAELKNISADKKIKLYLPTEYTFYERRKHERLELSQPCYVSMEINKVMVKKSIFDISLGGLAIVLPKSERMNIAKGKEFPIVTLDILGRKIKVKAECTSSVTIDRFKLESLPYGGFKIAFRFTEISKEDREFLVEFVTHQMLIKQHVKKAN